MCAIPAQSLGVTRCVLGVSQNIGDMNGLGLQQDSASYSPLSWRKRERLDIFIELGRVTVGCRGIVPVFLTGRTQDLSRIRLAQPRRRINKRFEHRRQIERRTADCLYASGGGGSW